jgi:hypothetical protein
VTTCIKSCSVRCPYFVTDLAWAFSYPPDGVLNFWALWSHKCSHRSLWHSITNVQVPDIQSVCRMSSTELTDSFAHVQGDWKAMRPILKYLLMVAVYYNLFWVNRRAASLSLYKSSFRSHLVTCSHQSISFLQLKWRDVFFTGVTSIRSWTLPDFLFLFNLPEWVLGYIEHVSGIGCVTFRSLCTQKLWRETDACRSDLNYFTEEPQYQPFASAQTWNIETVSVYTKRLLFLLLEWHDEFLQQLFL